jgi:two-component system, NtrC family, sensor kinase
MERAGMMLISAAPVRDDAGNIIGALCGGVLLNNNNTLVDRIKSIVYEGAQADGKDVGSATIFLGDLRIATNVLTSAGTRAIGTRLSEEVYNRVILRKGKWLGQAFVVNDWYFTAYEPILSLEGIPIGALYVGMMEKPHTTIQIQPGFPLQWRAPAGGSDRSCGIWIPRNAAGAAGQGTGKCSATRGSR